MNDLILTLRIHTTADGTRQVLGDVTGDIRRMEDAARRSSDGLGDAARAQRTFAAEGQRLSASLRSEQDRYNDSVANLRRHLEAGHISQQQHNRGLAEAERQLNATANAGSLVFDSYFSFRLFHTAYP